MGNRLNGNAPAFQPMMSLVDQVDGPADNKPQASITSSNCTKDSEPMSDWGKAMVTMLDKTHFMVLGKVKEPL